MNGRKLNVFKRRKLDKEKVIQINVIQANGNDTNRITTRRRRSGGEPGYGKSWKMKIARSSLEK